MDDWRRAGIRVTSSPDRRGCPADLLEAGPQPPPTPDKEYPPMPYQTRYVFTAAMDVDADREALFNEVYDTEHVPALLTVPGVIAVTRLTNEPVRLAMGGEVKEMVAAGEPRHHAVYEIESPEVLVSEAWARAVEQGRWASEVRPYTHNRRHTLKKVLA